MKSHTDKSKIVNNWLCNPRKWKPLNQRENPPHHSDIEHPEDEEEEGLGHSDDEDEGSVEHGQPGDRLGVDNVQDAWRHAELDAAEEAGQGARACDGN